MTPKISIITITYNSEKTLEKTIQSVVNQGYSNLEYLIIDGGSTDHTLDIVEKYKGKISFVISEPDKGISDAFNKGIKYATGEIIGLINSDDLLLPNAINALAKEYDESVDVYRGNTIIWNSQTDSKYRAVPTMDFSVYKLNPIVCHQSTFVTKRAYEKYGAYKVDYKFMMDADILIRLYQQKVNMKYINADLAVSTAGGVTDTSSYKKKLPEKYDCIISNGGNKLIATSIVCFFACKQLIKKLLIKIVDRDKLKKASYTEIK